MVKPRGKQRQIKLALLKKAQTTLKKCPQKSSKCWKRAWFLIRRRYNIYSVSPGWGCSLYCPPFPQCWCLIFKTSILPGPYDISRRNTQQVQNPSQGALCAEGRHFSRFYRLREATFHFHALFWGFFFFHSSNSARKSGYWIARMSATFPGLVHDAEVFKLISYHLKQIV